MHEYKVQQQQQQQKWGNLYLKHKKIYIKKKWRSLSFHNLLFALFHIFSESPLILSFFQQQQQHQQKIK